MRLSGLMLAWRGNDDGNPGHCGEIADRTISPAKFSRLATSIMVVPLEACPTIRKDGEG